MRQDRNRRDNRGYSPRSYAPVKVGDELTVTIDAIGEKGDGIAKKDGFVLFVPNTKKDDTVKIRITRVLPKVGFAEVVGETQQSESQPEEQFDDTPVDSGSTEESSEKTDDSSQDTEDFGEEDQ